MKSTARVYAAVVYLCLFACVVLCMPGCSKKEQYTPVSSTGVDPYAAERTVIRNSVAGIEAEVASFRGKPFLRPVTAAVFTRSEYTARVDGGLYIGSAEEENAKALSNRVLVRLGFLREGDDYFAESDEVLSTSVAGFYRSGTDSFWIIMPDTSWDLTLGDSATVFHELLHALQDQYYGLAALQSGARSSDHIYAVQYMIEGEAKFLDDFYYGKNILGTWPDPAVVANNFSQYAVNANSYIDQQLAAGVPCVVLQPFYWAYYSFGPLFIYQSTDGTDWSGIDDVFAAPPVKTREVMRPNLYTDKDRTGYVVNPDSLYDLLDREYTLFDYDCMGEMLTCTMLREWGVAAYRSAAQGLRTDCEMVAGNEAGTDLALYWLTSWDTQSDATVFVSAYRELLAAKYGITMPAAVSGVAEYAGTVPVLMKQDGTRVYVMENYDPARKADLLAAFEQATISDWTPVLARAAFAEQVPWVRKDRQGELYPLAGWPVRVKVH